MTAPELTNEERAVVERFEAADYPEDVAAIRAILEGDDD